MGTGRPPQSVLTDYALFWWPFCIVRQTRAVQFVCNNPTWWTFNISGISGMDCEETGCDSGRAAAFSCQQCCNTMLLRIHVPHHQEEMSCSLSRQVLVETLAVSCAGMCHSPFAAHFAAWPFISEIYT